LTVIPGQEQFSDNPGNVLILDDTTTAPLRFTGRVLKSVRSRWIGDTLQVTYDERARVVLKVTVLNGVPIVYSTSGT
jgi:hypothetical protein